MLHNNSSLIAISKTPNPTLFQKTLGINDFYYGDGEWEYPLGAMQMLGRSDPFTMSLDAPDADDPADLAARSLDFWLTTEDLPRRDNRVEVEPNGRVQLSLHARPISTPTSASSAKFRSLLDTMRCREEVIERSTYLGGRLGISGVAHQNGTVRFGADPTTARCSTSTASCTIVDNVYVTDSSFFVSSSAVNPTLTIIANALRVADRIADRLA